MTMNVEELRSRVAETSQWEDVMLAVQDACAEMGTFGKALVEDCSEWTYGRWQLERARRVTLAVLDYLMEKENCQ